MLDEKERLAEIKKLTELITKAKADLTEIDDLSAYDIICITDDIAEYQESLDDCKLLTEEHFAKDTVSELRWAIWKSVDSTTYNYSTIKRSDGTRVSFDKARKAELKDWLLNDDRRPRLVGQLTYALGESDEGREKARRLRAIGTVEDITNSAFESKPVTIESKPVTIESEPVIESGVIEKKPSSVKCSKVGTRVLAKPFYLSMLQEGDEYFRRVTFELAPEQSFLQYDYCESFKVLVQGFKSYDEGQTFIRYAKDIMTLGQADIVVRTLFKDRNIDYAITYWEEDHIRKQEYGLMIDSDEHRLVFPYYLHCRTDLSWKQLFIDEIKASLAYDFVISDSGSWNQHIREQSEYADKVAYANTDLELCAN